MPDYKTIRNTIAQLPASGPFVAILAGGTTGIGSYIAHSLARVFAHDGSRLRVYIVGRNADRAQAVITAGQTLSPGSDWRFIQGSDLALINQVDTVCETILEQESRAPLHATPSIDVLYLSFCVNILAKQRTTEEGLDAFMSFVYYARIRFIQRLLPMLTLGPFPGHVVSVYAGGFEDGTTDPAQPILLGQTSDAEWGVSTTLSLTHVYPGLFDGPAFYSEEMPAWFKWVWPVAKVVAKPYMTSKKDCGDVMVYLATGQFPARGGARERTELPKGLLVAKDTKGEAGGGSYAVGRKGDVARDVMFAKVRQSDTADKVWEHTFETLNGIRKQESPKRAE